MSFKVPPRHILTEKTNAHIATVFPDRQEEVAEFLKHECGNLYDR